MLWTSLTPGGRRVRLGSPAKVSTTCSRENAITFHTIGSQSSPCGFGLEEEGLSWRSACEDQAAKTAWKRKQLMFRCSCLLVRVIRSGVSAKMLLKATLISGSRLGRFTCGWLTLLEFMGQFLWIVVLCCSARMAFLTPFPMLRISECSL